MRPRFYQLIVLALVGVLAVPVAGSATDLPALEQAWHRCVREAFAHQPAKRSHVAAQRSALDECKQHEDAYVAAVMAARMAPNWQEEGKSAALSRGWAALVSAYVFDPITEWLRAPKR